MKYEDSQKITALGVVIFSFIALLIGTASILAIASLTALLVQHTNLPESLLKIGSVIGGGVGLLISSAFMTVKTKIKGIFSALIVAVVAVAIKLIGNHTMDLGGYFTVNGLIGILFTIIFSLAGGVVGASIKK
ncbi:MAG: hypothetical protein IJN80_06945 [Clostridia bacterium]|nr:hypothetical protein [Clostridia bacterium]